ncbi:MAG: very short patch repair endonuclease [Egibacteraceae bacterium]
MPGPIPSSDTARRRMQRQRRRDTRPETALRRALHAQGFRYLVDRQVLPEVRRKADIVFSRARVAVFVDGCFWHVCPQHATWPKASAEWWRAKLEANTRRDRDTDERLGSAGWTVVRVWEHEATEEAAKKVAEVVRAATRHSRPSEGYGKRS